MPLPSVQNSPDEFGANDTSYIHLNPDWYAETIGYVPGQSMLPVDIAIGEDDYIFIADNANNRVIAVTKSGQVATHQDLNTIELSKSPVGIDIDTKLNLLVVDGTNTVYVWNQYINNIGIESLLTRGETDTSIIYLDDPALLDSVLRVNPFYVDEDGNSSFQGVAFGPSADNTVFLTDKGNNRIVELKIYLSGAVLLKNGYFHPLFSGMYERDVATYGSGAGTVDNPRGITTDDAGNIYFTQLGGNFFVQKLKKQGDQYISAFTLYEDPIMDLNRFAGPCDIAIGEDDAIFVIDTADSGKVHKFYNKGSRAGIDANLGRKGLSVARFDQPLGIAISEGEIVYVINTGRNRIERYQYSVSDSDLPPDDDGR